MGRQGADRNLTRVRLRDVRVASLDQARTDKYIHFGVTVTSRLNKSSIFVEGPQTPISHINSLESRP